MNSSTDTLSPYSSHNTMSRFTHKTTRTVAVSFYFNAVFVTTCRVFVGYFLFQALSECAPYSYPGTVVTSPAPLPTHKGPIPFSTSRTYGSHALPYFSDIGVICPSLLLGHSGSFALLYFSDTRVTCPSLLLGH